MPMAKATQTPTQTPTQAAAKKQVAKAAEKDAQATTATPVAPKHPVPVPKIHHEKWEEFKAATGLDIYAPALTIDDAKNLLGWQTEADYIARLKLSDPSLNEDAAKEIFGKDYFLTDLEGNKVRLTKNTRNRPWGEGVSKAYMQDMLKRHWQFNGETVIIGQNERVLSGQHRLIGLVFAEQSRTLESEKDHWSEFWKDAVKIPIAVMYGVEESSEVTRTIDNVKSRTLSDVIFADTDLFGQYKAAERKTIARMVDYAVKLLWERMGEKGDKWAPSRTHSESLSFVDRHPRIKECIKHIYEEEKGDDKRVSRFVYPGHAAALMYLMATTGTPQQNIDDYYALRLEKPSDEKKLKFDNLKKAKMFWSDLARNEESVKAVRNAYCPLPGDDPNGGMTGQVFMRSIDGKAIGGDGKPDECIGVLVRAWNLYVKDQPIDQAGIELSYNARPSDDGTMLFELKEHPTIAESVDSGKKVKAKKEEKPPTPEANPDAMTELSDAEADEVAGEAQLPTIPKVKDDNAEKKQWDSDKKNYSGHILVYASPVPNSDNLLIYWDDAELWASIVGGTPKPHPSTGVVRLVLSPSEVEEGAQKVMEAGHNILLVSRPDKDNKRTITPYQLQEEEMNGQSDDVPEDEESEGEEPSQSENDESGNPPPAEPQKISQPNPAAKRVIVRKG